MAYKPRPGIVRLKICGTEVLMPLRTASDECKTMLCLSFQTVLLWECLKKQNGIDIYLSIMHKLTKKPKEEIRIDAETHCQHFYSLGFVSEVPDDVPADAAQPAADDESVAQKSEPLNG